MRTFDVYTHPAKGDQAVKQGFSWPASIFGGLWAFSHSMPLIGLGLIFVGFGLRILGAVAGPASIFVDLLVCFAIGAQGNNWRRSKLISRGYNLIKPIEAKSPQAAIAEYRRQLEAGEFSTEPDPMKIAEEAKLREQKMEQENSARGIRKTQLSSFNDRNVCPTCFRDYSKYVLSCGECDCQLIPCEKLVPEG